jgi:hypothetical protein
VHGMKQQRNTRKTSFRVIVLTSFIALLLVLQILPFIIGTMTSTTITSTSSSREQKDATLVTVAGSETSLHGQAGIPGQGAQIGNETKVVSPPNTTALAPADPPQNTSTAWRNFTTRSSSSSSARTVPSIVVHLGGELGNHLSALAHAKGLQLRLLQRHGLHTQLVLIQSTQKRKHASHKRQETKQTLKRCFPNIAPLFFPVTKRKRTSGQASSSTSPPPARDKDEEGDEEETLEHLLESRQAEQRAWLSNEQLGILEQVNNVVAPELNQNDSIVKRLDASLDLFHQLVLIQEQLLSSSRAPATTAAAAKPSSSSTSSRISLPFLETRTLSSHFMTNLYYSELRDFFELNTSSPWCCNARPSPNETVVVSLNHPIFFPAMNSLLCLWCAA